MTAKTKHESNVPDGWTELAVHDPTSLYVWEHENGEQLHLADGDDVAAPYDLLWFGPSFRKDGDYDALEAGTKEECLAAAEAYRRTYPGGTPSYGHTVYSHHGPIYYPKDNANRQGCPECGQPGRVVMRNGERTYECPTDAGACRVETWSRDENGNPCDVMLVKNE